MHITHTEYIPYRLVVKRTFPLLHHTYIWIQRHALFKSAGLHHHDLMSKSIVQQRSPLIYHMYKLKRSWTSLSYIITQSEQPQESENGRYKTRASSLIKLKGVALWPNIGVVKHQKGALNNQSLRYLVWSAAPLNVSILGQQEQTSNRTICMCTVESQLSEQEETGSCSDN